MKHQDLFREIKTARERLMTAIESLVTAEIYLVSPVPGTTEDTVAACVGAAIHLARTAIEGLNEADFTA